MVFKKGNVPWINGKKGIFSGSKNPFYGKHHTQESINKIKDSKKGKRCSPETEFKKGQLCGKKNPMYNIQLFGNLNGNWKGGITTLTHQIRTSDKYLKWRTLIFQKDSYICQECFKHGGDLEAHHKKSFSLILKEKEVITFEGAMECSDLWNVDNGQTLCLECHNKKHYEIKNIEKVKEIDL